MEMKKLFLKSTVLLGSVFVLAACGATETKEETTVAETTEVVTEAETTVEETTEAAEETTEAEESTEAEEETTEVAEESTEAEEETTEAEESTEAEEETTEAEEETTEAEEETTEAEESTEAEEETTEAAEETSEEVADGLQDGTYTVVGNPDERGWAVKHTIEVKDGKVVTSDFDYYNDKDERKTEDEEYNKKMEEVAKVSSKDAIAQLNDALVANQTAEVEVVSGASHTSENFEKSAALLLEKAAKGDTEETNMDEMTAELVDGEYTLESNADERGWAHTFTIVVKDGKVTESNYDMVDKDGNLKTENEEYNTAMKDKTKTSFADAVKALNDGLVEKQNPAELEVVSGATSTTDSFVEYAKLLLEAAAKGETETIKVELSAN